MTTMLISDHPHLFETIGENYRTDFTAWDYERGHETDPWKTRPDPRGRAAPPFGRGHMAYDNSRGYFRGEADFPGPRTIAAAARWLDDNAGYHDRFFLFVASWTRTSRSTRPDSTRSFTTTWEARI